MWDILGFEESPYNCRPLNVSSNDVQLLVGRNEEAVRFCTTLESAKQGIAIISGNPGVGKTSFLNVQQYLLETKTSICGPDLIACRHLSPVNPGDTAREIALRVLHNLYKSLIDYCSSINWQQSSEMEKIGKWIASRGNSGFEFGLTIAGFGGTVGRHLDLPPIQDVSFETLTDVIFGLVSEAVNYLRKPGIIIALDNLENLEESELAEMLITFRDTLFALPCVWWVLIGQSGLGSYIQSLDPRVFQRISGTALELNPIHKIEFHEAIEQRVLKFHSLKQGKAPLDKEVHDFLYDAAKGQIRFVFKYSNDICSRWVSNTRIELLDEIRKEGKQAPSKKIMNDVIGEYLIDCQIESKEAFEILKQIVSDEFMNLNLTPKEIEILKGIGDKGKVRPKEHDEFSIKTMQQFSSQFLMKLHKQNLLAREQEGKAVLYSLSGLSLIAHGFNLF